jgi:hypothetical protein
LIRRFCSWDLGDRDEVSSRCYLCAPQDGGRDLTCDELVEKRVRACVRRNEIGGDPRCTEDLPDDLSA